MLIKSVQIKKFRSIRRLDLEFGRMTLLSGPNSCGKSNVLRAILLAFGPDLPATELAQHIPVRDRGTRRLSIEVAIVLTECPAELCRLVGADEGADLTYLFRVTRGGTYTRALAGRTITHEQLSAYVDVQYVPPIRDLTGDGMGPFRKLLAQALRRARGAGTLNAARDRAAGVLQTKAQGVLGAHRDFVRSTLGADALELDTSEISLEDLYEAVSLRVRVNGQTLSLSDFGTGHQSAIILRLFRQYGETFPGATIFLFEEPDNHLHPATIRMIGDDLASVADTSQVIATTHSPVLISHVGLRNVRALINIGGETQERRLNLAGLSDREIRSKIASFGLRATEPLLARRIIVCEGASDVAVLTELALRRFGRSPDQMDVVITAAGSAGSVVNLCRYLRALGVDWRAVFDHDAAINHESAFTHADVAAADRAAALAAIQAIIPVLGTGKRGGGTRKNLLSIEAELNGNRPEATAYVGSKVQQLLEGTVTQAEATALADLLSRPGRRNFQAAFSAKNVWLWSGDLESVLVHNDAAAAIVDQEMVRLGLSPRPAAANGRLAEIRSRLHNLGEDAESLRAITGALSEQNALGRTELIEGLNFLFR